MSNRLTRRRRAIIAAGCVFCAAALLLTQGAQGAVVACQLMARGDQLSSQSDWTWSAGSGDLGSVPPLTCGNEIIIGGYASRTLSQSPTTYQAMRSVDSTEIIQFQTATELSGLDGLMRESFMTMGAAATFDPETCQASPETEINASGYNEQALVSSLLMGHDLSYRSQGAIVQADTEQPDSMAAQMLAEGNGMAQMTASTFSQVGIGNTTAIGYEQRTFDQIRVSGQDIQAGLSFQFTSFAGLWEED